MKEEETLLLEEHPLYLKGREEGYQKAYEESLSVLNLLQTVVAKILEEKRRLITEIKPELVEFALQVCEKVLRKELSQPMALVKMINSLLEAAIPLLQGDKIQVLLHPEDMVLLEHSLSHISYDTKAIRALRFVPINSVKQGDVRIEGETGLLNYSIERILEDLRNTLHESVS
jgi:flagellar biosynthesis/type III secretory pathway protein FliH